MTTKIPNRKDRVTADKKLIDGLTKHETTLASLVIDTMPYKTADAIAILQEILASSTAVTTARAAWQAAVATDRSERVKRKAFLSGLRQALRVAFGSQIDALADFGLAPRKPHVARTPEQKQQAAAKARATRAARHTLGSKQKAKIRGEAPTPSGAAPAPAPLAAPDSPAGASGSAASNPTAAAQSTAGHATPTKP